MLFLKTTCLVEGVAVRAIGEGRALTRNSFPEDFLHRGVDSFPVGGPEKVARDSGVKAGTMEKLGSIEVSHAGQDTLVQQGHFDRSAAGAKPSPEFSGRDFQGIGAESFRS